MFAVIFKADIHKLDQNYSNTADKLRELAIKDYGCIEFISALEGNQEIAISYWENLDQIKLWKQNAEHLLAQKFGQNQWYKSYQVQIVEVLREYRHNT